MKSTAQSAIELGLLCFATDGTKFPGRSSGSGCSCLVDIRGAISNIKLRHLIVSLLCKRFLGQFSAAEVIAGISKAGVPWATLLAWEVLRPSATVHLDGPRNSGLQRQVEGTVCGKRCIVVDNISRSGKSIMQAEKILCANGADVIGSLTIVDSCQVASDLLGNSVWSIRELLEAAVDVGDIDEKTLISILEEKV